MAYIAKTAFEIKVSNHEFDSTSNITGVFYNATPAEEICSAGFLCKKDELLPNEGYAGVNNNNTWKMKAAVAADLVDTAIYACNTFDVNEVQDPVNGNIYKVGANTLGLPAPAGRRVTYTRIKFAEQGHYRFGVGNLSTELGSNTYFTIANGLLVPAATAPTVNGTPYFKLLGTGNFTEGAYNSFGYVDVEAHYVIVNAG